MKKLEKKIEFDINEKIINDFYLPHLFDYTHKIEVYKGGAGSSKSYSVFQKVILKSLSMSKRKVLVIRKVGATLRDSCWQLTLDILEQFKILEQCKINKNEFRITLPNKSVFLFKGLDDSEKIKSITEITDIICEEISELVLDDYTQLLLRLRSKAKFPQFFCMFNPISKKNFTWSIFKFTEENQCQPIREYDDVIIFSTTYKDNRFLSADYVKTLEEMKETNPYYYQVYALGKFGEIGKIIYNNWKVDKLDIDDLVKQKLILCSGIDYGFTHPYTVCISFVNQETKTIYVIDEYSRSEVLAEDVYEWICKKGYSKNSFIMDSAAAGEIKKLTNLGLNVEGCNKKKYPVVYGITSIMNYKIIIDEHCNNFIDEIMSYSWKKDKNGYYTEEPQGIHDDLLDAWRYSLQKIFKPKQKKPFALPIHF